MHGGLLLVEAVGHGELPPLGANLLTWLAASALDLMNSIGDADVAVLSALPLRLHDAILVGEYAAAVIFALRLHNDILIRLFVLPHAHQLLLDEVHLLLNVIPLPLDVMNSSHIDLR